MGMFHTHPIYTLYDCGCPCLAEGGTTSVVGEVYKTNLEDVMDVHSMELYAGYKFKPVALADFEELTYAYFQSPKEYGLTPIVIESGDYIAYRYEDKDREAYKERPDNG